MFRVIFSLLLSFCLINSYSQQFYIKGRVTDEESQLSLKGASVYINNSTKGTVTNDNGEFEIGPLMPGRYEVVASYVGYTALLYSAEIATESKRIIFKLGKKEEVLREVLVLSEELRKRYLEIFKENLLGKSVAAERCQIKNIEEVQFVSGQTKDEILAFTEKELVIENPEFGYTINFELLDFYYNKSSTVNYFFGYTRYVDWGKDEQTKKKWLRKRKQAYNGSTVHFFRSLINKRLGKEGFSVYQLINMQKGKKDSMQLISYSQGSNNDFKIGARAIEDSMLRIYSDSAYRVYEMRINDGWRIVFSKDTDLKNELMRKNIFLGQPGTGTISGLRLRQTPVLINEKGIILTPVNVFYDGIWAFERLANMLPRDYEPE